VPTITINGKDYLVDEGVTPEQVQAHIGSTGYNAMDALKSAAAAIPVGAANVARLGGRLLDAASIASDVPIRESGFSQPMLAGQGPGASGMNAAADWLARQQQAVGLVHAPQTPAGRYGQAAGEGIGGTLASGGVGAVPLLLGAAGGLGGEAGQQITGSPLGRFLGALIPGAGYGGLKALVNPGGKTYANAREGLARTEEQLANQRPALPPPQAVQAAAQANRVPIAGFQAYPQDTAMQMLGQQAAVQPGASAIQSILRNQQGPAADLSAALQGPAAATEIASPSSASQLLANLRGSARLQNADLLHRGTPGQHEMGQAAALAEIGGEHIPGLKTLIPGGAFAAQRGWKEFLFGQPSQKAEQAIYGAPTIEAMAAAAQRNPRNEALAQMLRAYMVPIGQGQPTPQEQSK
jgi:hypothetical protein